MIAVHTKGWITSEGNFGLLKFPKNEIIARISALASKMGQIKSIMTLYYIK